MKYYSLKTLEDFSTALLTSKGVPENNARYMAEMAVKTEAMGITTHGLSVLGYLDNQIPEIFLPQTEPEVVREKGAVALIDGKNGFSQLALKKATEMAIEKAGKMGVAMIAIKNSCWLGALGPYLEPIARAGFMAQLWGQSSQCMDCAPVGGIVPKFSTNPVALAFPTSGDPVIADISTAAVSMGAVMRMAKNNEKAEDKIFMDKEGRATDDPHAMLDNGSIFFLGGQNYAHKGFGLSLWAEALTAMGGGSSNNPDLEQHQSLNLMVVDIDAFIGKDYFQQEITRFIAHMKNNTLRPGFDAIRLPGERAFKSLALAKMQGITLDDARLKALNDSAQKNGVSLLQ
jgi:LDH2 family malate/lactate/ureidoglycolate dehydrogenase